MAKPDKRYVSPTDLELELAVEAWHKSGYEMTIPVNEWLGLSKEEYAKWVETGKWPLRKPNR